MILLIFWLLIGVRLFSPDYYPAWLALGVALYLFLLVAATSRTKGDSVGLR